MPFSKTIIITGVVIGLCACTAVDSNTTITNTASSVEATAPAVQPVTAQHRHDKHTHGQVATVKPGASITLNPVLPKTMSSGAYQTVRLELQDGYGEGVMSVNVVPSDGLSLFGSTSSKTFNMAAPGPHVWDLDVKADTDGVYFLNVFSEAQGQPRSFSVRLDMGVVTQKMLSDAMPSEGELIDGGKIRVLDAEETIR